MADPKAGNAPRRPRAPHPSFVNMTGQTRGGFYVLERAPNDSYGNACWKVQHTCGGVDVLPGIAIRAARGVSAYCKHCRPNRFRRGSRADLP